MDYKTILVSIISALFSGIIVFMLQVLNAERTAKRNDKMELFKTLMQMRYMTVSHEKTKALNSIEIMFYDCKPVLDAWKELYDAYAVDLTNKSDEQKILYKNNIDDKEIALLEEIANNLGYNKIKWHSIKKSYTPIAISRDIINNEDYKQKQVELMNLQIDIAKHQYDEILKNRSLDT